MLRKNNSKKMFFRGLFPSVVNHPQALKHNHRTLVIGDVHGCYHELMDLLDKAQLRSDDHMVFVGDLINRGPSSRRVLNFVMATRNAQSVLGNHEHNLLQYFRGRKQALKSAYQRTVAELGDRLGEYIEFLAQLPYQLELDDAWVVHAGVRPGVPILQQDPEDLVNLRRLAPREIPWYELYRGQKPIIFGHWARQSPLVLKNVVGLDTGCVYGGRLTGLFLPAFELVSVPARRIYVHKPDKLYWAASVAV